MKDGSLPRSGSTPRRRPWFSRPTERSSIAATTTHRATAPILERSLLDWHSRRCSLKSPPSLCPSCLLTDASFPRRSSRRDVDVDVFNRSETYTMTTAVTAVADTVKAEAEGAPTEEQTKFAAFLADQAAVDRVMEPVYEHGDRVMRWFVLGHAAISVVLAAFYETWSLSLIVTSAATLMFLVSVKTLPRHRITRIVAGIVLQTFVALHIY